MTIKTILRNYTGIFLGLITIITNLIFGFVPSLTEELYFKGIFQALRVAYDYTLGFLPFPSVYALYLIFIYIIAQFLKQLFHLLKMKDRRMLIRKMTKNILSFLGVTIFLFYFLWGFNYKNPGFTERLKIPATTVDTSALYSETMEIMHLMVKTREWISTDSTISLLDTFLQDNFEDELRFQLTTILKEWNYPSYGRVRVRLLQPRGSLLRISTAGVYIPFVGEGHIDAGLHPLQWPFTMAHEMSHGYGFTDEGVCNFIGFLTCIRSEDAYIRYSGLMGYWRYLASNLRRASPNLYKKATSVVPMAVRNDLNEVIEFLDRYPDILPDVRDRIYESYLKSHGIHGGLANYSTIVRLVMGWKQTTLNRDIFNRLYTVEPAPPSIQ